MPLVLKDGYTLDGKVPARHGWPEVKFQYRPALPGRVYDYLKEDTTTGERALAADVAVLKDTLVKWDVLAVTAANGDKPAAAPLDEATFRKLPHPVLKALVDVVTGYGSWEADAKN